MVNRIAVYAEGPTEWYTVYQLRKRGILAQADMVGCGDRDQVGRWIINRRKLKNIFANPKLPEYDGILFILDQEDNESPFKAARDIADGFFELSSLSGFDNIFTGQLSNRMNVAFHISSAPSPDGNRDFDGYLLKILDTCGDDAVNLWFEMEAHDYLKRHFSDSEIHSNQIRALGREEIPDLMERSHWDILRNKTMLYAYITALQTDKSHVWFSEKVIKLAPPPILKDVFTNLIAAWYFLAGAENDEI